MKKQKQPIVLLVLQLIVMGGIAAAWISLIPHQSTNTTARQ